MKKSRIFEVEPEEVSCSKEFCQLINSNRVRLENIQLSSVVLDGKVKHYILAVWHDFEYGEENF
jgi:hypothetical protein